MSHDHFHEECGIIGVFGHPESSTFAYLGLHALQHRGKESAGIVSHDGKKSYIHKGMGLVGNVFKKKELARLNGHAAIGHVRYSTTGSSSLKNAQPFAVEYSRGPIAVAHNGNLINANTIRHDLENKGSIFQSTMDTEVVIHLIAHAKGDPVERIMTALSQLSGAYCMVFLTEGRLIAARDPRGWRPLILGKKGDAHIIASETCALDLIEGEYLREIEPGEVLIIDDKGLQSKRLPAKPLSLCVFEYIYFSRPDSTVFGEPCYTVRMGFGARLAEEHPADVDVVFAVPDSGVPAAMGFAKASGIPYELGLTRNHYTGRTFIEPEESIRHFGVRRKLNPNRAVIAGKRVAVIDDSIVRGTTMRKIITMIRNAGAKEIHVRISSPPICCSCYYGIDTPTKTELIANKNTVVETAEALKADSLGYLSQEGLASILPQGAENFCFACFDGRYPEVPDTKAPERQLALFDTPPED